MYASLASTLVAIPEDVDVSEEVKDFIYVQKQELVACEEK